MAITIRTISEAFAAECVGIDLSAPINDPTLGKIKDAFAAHPVLLFRGQSLTPQQQIAYSRKFGELEIHVSKQYLLSEHPEILLLTNERNPDGSRISIADGGTGWHSDLSYLAKPAMGSLLYAVRTPSDPKSAQDTEWGDMYRAYETLPDKIRRRIDGLKAIHVFNQDLNPRMPPIDTRYRDKHTSAVRDLTPPVKHPIVRIHPVTGRKSLYVSIRFTVGIADIDEKEGGELLDQLFDHQRRPEIRFLHKWIAGDLIMWDNRCTNHRAVGKVAELPNIRRMHRTTLSGDTPY